MQQSAFVLPGLSKDFGIAHDLIGHTAPALPSATSYYQVAAIVWVPVGGKDWIGEGGLGEGDITPASWRHGRPDVQGCRESLPSCDCDLVCVQ